MLKALAALVAVGLGTWGLAYLLTGNGQREAANLAVAVTLPAAVLTMALADFIGRRWPLIGVTAIVAGNALRMGWAAVMVVVLGKQAERWETTSTALAAWTVAFYLLLLVVETALLAGRLRTRVPRDPAER